MVFLFWLLFFGGGGGGGGCFFLVGFVVVRFSFGWLVGCFFFPGVLLKGGNFLVSTFSYHAECGYAFFFFFLFSFFFWLSWRGGWIMHLRVVPID